MKSTIQILSSIFLVVTFALTSCKKKENPKQETSNTSLLDGIFLEAAPPEAAQVSTLFADPTPGKKVTVSGEVMGTMDPFVDGRAMVVIGDPTKLTPCNRIPGDSCETPWDVCCDDANVIKTSIATIQVVDDQGHPFKQGLKGMKGLDNLSFITVTGTIAEGSNANNLLVNATGIHVASESPYKNAKPVNNHE